MLSFKQSALCKLSVHFLSKRKNEHKFEIVRIMLLIHMDVTIIKDLILMPVPDKNSKRCMTSVGCCH